MLRSHNVPYIDPGVFAFHCKTSRSRRSARVIQVPMVIIEFIHNCMIIVGLSPLGYFYRGSRIMSIIK